MKRSVYIKGCILGALLWALIIFGVAQCFGAAASCSTAGGGAGICYIDNASAGGDGTTTGLSGANAAFATIAAYAAKTYTDGDQILFVRGGVWAEAIIPPTGGSDDTHRITIGAYGSGSPPRITGNGTYSYSANSKGYITVQHLQLEQRVFSNNAPGLVFKYCLMKNSTATGVDTANTGTTTLDHCTIINSATTGVYATNATNAITMTNSIVMGNGTVSGYGVRRDGSVFSYANSLISGNGAGKGIYNISAGLTDSGGNILNMITNLVSYSKNAAYFVLTSDDHDVAYWLTLSSMLATYGVKMTFYVQPDQITVGEQTDLATLSAAGHEVATHSWSHSPLGGTNAFTVTTTNDNPTVTLSRAASTLTLYTTTAGNTVTVDWSTSDKSISDLKTAVSGKGWTITNSTSPFNTMNNMRLNACSDSAGAQALPFTITVDITSENGYPFWAEEVTDTNTWLASITGITPNTMSCPYGNTSAELQTWQQSVAGFKGSRGINGTGIPQSLSSVNIFNLLTILTTADYVLGDGSEAVVRSRTRQYYDLCKNMGAIYILYFHTASDFSVAQIGYIVDEVIKAGGTWKTFSQLIDAIKADHSTADSITYTKTYADVLDAHLRINSPAVGTGADPGATLGYIDLAGNDIRRWNKGRWPIGAYQLVMTAGSGG
jgi:hypothetical protein